MKTVRIGSVSGKEFFRVRVIVAPRSVVVDCDFYHCEVLVKDGSCLINNRFMYPEQP